MSPTSTSSPPPRRTSPIATSSIATDMIKGQPLSEALKLTNKAVVEALDGLPPAKIHCSVLAEQAVKAALADYYTKNGIENKKKEVSDSDIIEETLFFYPLSGMLNALISAIYKKNNSSKN